MSQKTVEQIPLDKIICGKQPRERFDEKSQSELCQSIRENGVIQPILVSRLGDMYPLIVGGRRVRSARKAGWTTIPGIVEERELTKTEILLRQIVENMQRVDLNPIEKAKAIASLVAETHWTGSQIADKLGISPGSVTRLQALLTLPEEMHKQIESGELKLTAGYELTKLPDDDQRAELARQAVSGELNRDQIVQSVKSRKQAARRKPKSVPYRVTAILDARTSVAVCADNLDLDIYIRVLETALALARKARPQNILLDTHLKMLRDRAKVARVGAASTTMGAGVIPTVTP
jgi:ParB family chromosome partitioning protein